MLAFRLTGIPRILPIMLLVAIATFSAKATDDTMDRARLEKMLADGDTGMIVQVFRRHPGRTLPFIDRYLEGGLAMIEKDGNPQSALASFQMGIQFAVLADEAFPGTVFSDYANSFASFSPSEQKNFREGQKAYKEGMKEPDPKKSQERLWQSLALARSLGDTWGQAMAWGGLAEAALKAGDLNEALRAATQAIELNRALQLREDCVQSLMLGASISAKISEPEAGAAKTRTGQGSLGYLAQAFLLVQHDLEIDESLRNKVFEQYVAVLEAAGMKDRADLARRDFQPAIKTQPAMTAPSN